jgi:glycosyltransferase involved in cell wall biosynthesis
MAMLFPIQWGEPFGLVMLEAMACGTPVLAMPGGSVPEVVHEGVSGYICRSVRDMAKRVGDLGGIHPATVRRYVEENFSIDKMVREYLSLYQAALNGTVVAGASSTRAMMEPVRQNEPTSSTGQMPIP